MKDFILQPWEYQGAIFNPKAHAETRLELGGKKRNFLLKLREGVLFFKEPSRSQVFAIPQIFEDSLATDSIGLISAFQRETAAGNYGALIVKRDYFAKLPVRGQFILLFCADGTGWMREHFDTQWFNLPEWEPFALDLWNDNVEIRTRPLFPLIQDSLLQRTVEPEVRQAETPHWIGGSSEEVLGLIHALNGLFLRPSDYTGPSHQLVFKVKSYSAFAKGEVDEYWFRNALRSPHYRAIWELIEKQFHYVGVKWSEGGEQSELYPRLRVERVFQAGLKEWGENWRGNWAPQRGSFEVPVSDLTTQSAHEKLESALLLRHWLKDKMPAEQSEEMFQSISLN